MSDGAFLSLDGVRAGYGPTVVIDGAELSLAPGESLSIIGRNGVGKTTLLATLMGHTTVHAGTIRFKGADLTRVSPHKRARIGIGYVPQEREIFPSLTVRENLHVGARGSGWTEESIFALFPNIKARLGNRGNELSGGEQQMLSIARALMGNPSLLLMDEPSEGLAPVIVEELARAMKKLRSETGISIILVEQNTRVALDFSERVVVLDRGKISYDGPSQPLREDDEKLHALIGVGA